MINYNKELTLEEQDSEIILQINDLVNNTPALKITSEPAGFCPRILKETWELTDDLYILRIYNYKYPANHERNGEHNVILKVIEKIYG